MNRRSFLQLMFSLAAGKAVERVLPTLPPSPVLYPTGGNIVDVQAWKYARNFELTASSPVESLSIAVDRDAPFALHRMGLLLDPKCDYETLQQFYNEVFFKMAVGNDDLFAGPVNYIGTGMGLPIYPALLLSDRGINVSLEAAKKWVPPAGIKGQIIMQGVKVYSPLRDMPSKR